MVVRLSGTVASGIGASASFLSIPWVSGRLSESLGFSPYCGTLNIRLADPAFQRLLKKAKGERIVPEEEGFCEALLFGGTVAGRYRCGVVLPLVPGYPEDIIEVVAPVHLKSALGIGDGDVIEVEIVVP